MVPRVSTRSSRSPDPPRDRLPFPARSPLFPREIACVCARVRLPFTPKSPPFRGEIASTGVHGGCHLAMDTPLEQSLPSDLNLVVQKNSMTSGRMMSNKCSLALISGNKRALDEHGSQCTPTMAVQVLSPHARSGTQAISPRKGGELAGKERRFRCEREAISRG